MQFDYDLFVIGAGSGGVRAARIASALGAKVAIAEDLYFGGTCVNVGCVPKKLYVYASEFSEEFAAAAGFGWQKNEAQHDWSLLKNNKDKEIQRLGKIYEKLLIDANVTVLNGRAEICGAHKVKVSNKEITAERILLAVGSWPRQPEFEGAEHCLSSNDIFRLEKKPKRVLIQGGGYIAIEFAGIFSGLGCETELIYRGDLFLRGFDTEVRCFVKKEVEKKGVRLSFNQDIKCVKKVADQYCVEFLSGETRVVDAVVSAIGRVPKLQGLGLEKTQIQTQKSGHIIVDENFETHEAGVFAIGDVVGKKELTPVALAEGMALAKFWFAGEAIQLVYENIPTAVFCQPNIATIGLSEDEAKERNLDVDIYTSTFKPLKNTLSGIDEKTLMKLIVDKSSDRVIGCHMVGSHAGEIIQGIAIAITAGASKADFDKTIGIHPTAAEEFVTMRTPV